MKGFLESRDVLYRIAWELDELPLLCTFDLSLFHQIDGPDVVDHIQRVGVVFYDWEELTSPK